jgi:SAM-dependent methyltransferase
MTLYISIKDLKKKDINLLYKWRNTDYFIKRSQSKEKVSFLSHRIWFENILLTNTYSKIIYFKSHTPIGHFRIDKINKSNVVTIYIIKKFTGIGIGTFIINYCVRDYLATKALKNTKIIAMILKNNLSASNLFSKSGFVKNENFFHSSLAKFEFKLKKIEYHNLTSYLHSFKTFKNSFKSLQWGSFKSQKTRFNIISNLIFDHTSHSKFSLLDVGCGLGDFYSHISKNYKVSYMGIDNSPYFIKYAINKHRINNFYITSIFNKSFFNKIKFDYVIASGLFTFFKSKYLFHKAIFAMWKLSKKGIIFNCLLFDPDNIIDGELSFKHNEVLNYCKKISPKIKILSNYHPNDFTIFMYK